MKIPKQLKIGGHVIKIVRDLELPGENGNADTEKNQINICKNLPQSQKESTLIHEIFHFLNTTMDGDIGHMLMDSLSEQFYQVLKDNKMLR